MHKTAQWLSAHKGLGRVCDSHLLALSLPLTTTGWLTLLIPDGESTNLSNLCFTHPLHSQHLSLGVG